MTLEIDSKPTRTRRAKSLEEQVAEADAIPYEPRRSCVECAANIEVLQDFTFEGRAPLCSSCYVVMMNASTEAENTGEIEITPEQQAEFERRARMGLGGPQEPTILVTTYDANGEAIDAEVVRSARAQEAAATGEPDPDRIPQSKQIEMPGFEGHKATKVTVSFSGSITLDLSIDRHKAMWDELRWQTHKSLTVTAFVNGKGFKAGKDNVAGASLTVMSAHLEEDAYGLPEGDDPCEGCGRESDAVTSDDVPLCRECFDSLLAEQADGADDPQPFEEIEELPAPEPPMGGLTGTELDQALATALEDGDA